MRVLFLVNARSGIRRKYDIPALIGDACRALHTDHTVQMCGRIEDLDGIVDDAMRQGFHVIYAVGGDGTVHEIGKRLIGRNIALGILPTGSGNGFARHLGLPTDTAQSIAACHDGTVVDVDTAEVNGIPFLGVLGLGLDAIIAEKFAASDVRGMRTYVREGVRAFRAFRPEQYEIEIDGRKSSRTAWVVAIANSNQYGNNARIAPIASLQDGLLNLVTIDRASLITAPFLLMRLFRGTIHNSDSVTVAEGREIVIRRAAEGPAHLDGEPLILPAELRVRVRPRSLKVVVPVTERRL